MSINALFWAFKAECPNAQSRYLLIDLANRVNDDGVCWPHVTTIAADTLMSRDSVMRHLKDLVDANLIAVERVMRGLTRCANRYRLLVPPKVADCDLPNENVISFPKVANSDIQPDRPITARRSQSTTFPNVAVCGPESRNLLPPKVADCDLHIEEEPVKVEPIKRVKDSPPVVDDAAVEARSTPSESGGKSAIDAEFDELWSFYPRHVARKQALIKYRMARKRASRETIETGVRRYALANRKTDQKYLKHFSTWLHNDCWEDGASNQEIPRNLIVDEKINARIIEVQMLFPKMPMDKILQLSRAPGCGMYPVSEYEAWQILRYGEVSDHV